MHTRRRSSLSLKVAGFIALVTLATLVVGVPSALAGTHVYRAEGIMPPAVEYSSGGPLPSKVFNRISTQHQHTVWVGWIYADGNGQYYHGTGFKQIGTHGIYRQASARCWNGWTGNVYGTCIWYD